MKVRAVMVMTQQCSWNVDVGNTTSKVLVLVLADAPSGTMILEPNPNTLSPALSEVLPAKNPRMAGPCRSP